MEYTPFPDLNDTSRDNLSDVLLFQYESTCRNYRDVMLYDLTNKDIQ